MILRILGSDRRGHADSALWQRDAQNSYLAGELIDEGPTDPLWGHSITWRIAVGPQAGREVLTLQTLPAGDPGYAHAPTNVGAFGLHAGGAGASSQDGYNHKPIPGLVPASPAR
jgi:hypothetical protein